MKAAHATRERGDLHVRPAMAGEVAGDGGVGGVGQAFASDLGADSVQGGRRRRGPERDGVATGYARAMQQRLREADLVALDQHRVVTDDERGQQALSASGDPHLALAGHPLRPHREAVARQRDDVLAVGVERDGLGRSGSRPGRREGMRRGGRRGLGARSHAALCGREHARRPDPDQSRTVTYVVGWVGRPT
jgi:hypothetical protein